MTGKETAGYAAAESGLYEGAPWVLTPLPRTTTETSRRSLQNWRLAIGSLSPLRWKPVRHDRLVAAISHLPYLLASGLGSHSQGQQCANDAAVWDLAAGGFRDTSRVAASDTQMFLDILMTNRDAVLAQMDTMSGHLQELRTLLADSDEESLRTKLSCSQTTRAAWKPKQGVLASQAE